MSEFFLELFSEEIPAGLQKNLREKLLEDFQKLFEKNSIKSKKNFSLSSPNRLVLIFENLEKQIKIKSEEIKGPKIDSSNQALEGFVRSNKIDKKDLYERNTENLFKIFDIFESEAKSLVEKKISLPAYDQCLKASHVFNVLDARGVISVAQRAEFISRIREITKSVAEIWIDTQV